MPGARRGGRGRMPGGAVGGRAYAGGAVGAGRTPGAGTPWLVAQFPAPLRELRLPPAEPGPAPRPGHGPLLALPQSYGTHRRGQAPQPPARLNTLPAVPALGRGRAQGHRVADGGGAERRASLGHRRRPALPGQSTGRRKRCVDAGRALRRVLRAARPYRHPRRRPPPLRADARRSGRRRGHRRTARSDPGRARRRGSVGRRTGGARRGAGRSACAVRGGARARLAPGRGDRVQRRGVALPGVRRVGAADHGVVRGGRARGRRPGR